MVFIETRPKINDLATVTMDENTSGKLTFNVTDATMANQSNIVVTASLTGGSASFDANVVVTQGTTATERIVTILPLTNQPSATTWNLAAKDQNTSGKVRISAVNANNVTSTAKFDLALIYKNQLPYIVETADTYLDENSSKTLTFRIGDVDSKWHGTNTLIYPANTAMFPKQDDNYKLTFPSGLETDKTKVPNQNPVGNPPSSSAWPIYSINFVPVKGAYGTNDFFIVQYNNDGRATTNTIKVGVKNILNAPTFELKTPPLNAAAGTLSTNLGLNILTSYEVPAADLEVTVRSLNTTRIPNDPAYIKVTKGSSGDKRNIQVLPVGNSPANVTVPMEVTVRDTVNNLRTTSNFDVIVRPASGLFTQYGSANALTAPAGRLTSFDIDATGFNLKGNVAQASFLLDGLVAASPADLDILVEAVHFAGKRPPTR